MFQIGKCMSLFMLCRKFRHVSGLLSKLFNKFGSLFRLSIKFRQSCFRVVACHNPGAGNINPEAFELVGNMRILICIRQGGLHSLSASSCIFVFQN